MVDRPATVTELRVRAEEIADMAAGDVVGALRKVMAELPAIAKDQQASPAQGGYAYRGIEQITRAAQHLFARHGVVFVPQVRHVEVRDVIVANKAWTDTQLTVAYTIYGPGGPRDRIDGPIVVGIGRGNADKGANKALTQAFKYALLQVLCISDAKDDTDGQTHEADAPAGQAPQVPAGWESFEAASAAHKELRARAAKLEPADRERFENRRAELGWPLSVELFSELEQQVKDLEEDGR